MTDVKNKTSYDETVDEALLQRFFADSARMDIADDGFTDRLMRRLPEEVDARCYRLYRLWTAAMVAVCVAVFFFVNGFQLLKLRVCGAVGGFLGDVVHAVEDLTNGQGCKIVIEAAGVPDTIRILPYVVRFGGSIGQIGACCEPVLVDWSYIHFKGVKITCPMQETFRSNRVYPNPELTMKLLGRLDFDDIITHRIPLTAEAAEDIFAKIEKGDEVIKAIFEIAEE